MASYSRLTLQTEVSIEQLLRTILQLPAESQLDLAERIKKEALKQKWKKYIESSPSKEPSITIDEINAEVKAVRQARYARRKK